MNIIEVRQELRTKTLSQIPLRVVHYGRVSTDRIEQHTSIEHQEEYYTRLIQQNERWELCGNYIDDGVSGIQANKRDSFQQMISDAKAGKFDLIITKEISRFARNTLDSIQYTRTLLKYGVCVWFMNDNINTIDEDSEFRLTIMAGVAQDEIRKLSSRVKFGHAQSIKNGVVLGNSHIYGYDKNKGKLTINEKEAEMVRLIFQSYASREHSTSTIEKLLWEKGYRNYKGGCIDRGVIQHIIRNPKYKGYYAGGKVKIVDMFTKKQEFVPEKDWVLFKDETGEIVPAIVSEELWQKANDVMDSRSKEIKERRTSFKRDNLYTGKLICGNCGKPFWLKTHSVRHKKYDSWVCSSICRNGKKSCDAFPLKEEELNQIVVEVLRLASGDIKDIVDYYMNLYQKILDSSMDSINSEIYQIREKIQTIHAKKNKILDFNLDGKITDDEFIKRNNAFNQELVPLEEELKRLTEHKENEPKTSIDFDKLYQKFLPYAEISEDDLTQAIIAETIDKIYVQQTNPQVANLVFVLNTGTKLNFPYKKKLRRSDDMSLTI